LLVLCLTPRETNEGNIFLPLVPRLTCVL
jgi:hypothetical protein